MVEKKVSVYYEGKVLIHYDKQFCSKILRGLRWQCPVGVRSWKPIGVTLFWLYVCGAGGAPVKRYRLPFSTRDCAGSAP